MALSGERTELAADIVEKGIVLTGGGANLRDMDAKRGNWIAGSIEDPLFWLWTLSGKSGCVLIGA